MADQPDSAEINTMQKMRLQVSDCMNISKSEVAMENWQRLGMLGLLFKIAPSTPRLRDALPMA
jgi:hypothetical protein